jgi:hypothetical protein
MLLIDFSAAGRFSLKRRRIGESASCTGMVRGLLLFYSTN